jgi:TolB-like protein/Tfp pilus assembly protein PilF
VLAVYIAAAFMGLELLDMISEPFGLPDWSMRVGFFVLLTGLVITLIIAWIYDIRPEGGLVKTVPADEVKADEITTPSNRWKMASYVSFFVIAGLIVLNILSRPDRVGVDDKSIAVLPFESLSNDPELQYQADGVMDAILLHLSKIEDLRVISRTSVEQYRHTDKTITRICEELGVAYVLEGSFQKSGDKMRLIVQLIRSGTEGHIWANNYDREWKDIFSVQSEVAQRIASELHAAITPGEKELIEKIPTTSLTAYDFYQKGRDEHFKYWADIDNKEALQNAEDYYHEALKYDPSYAQAYTGLAWVYRNKNYWREYFSGSFLDSGLHLTETALRYDDQLADAYLYRGRYYRATGNTAQAIEGYDKAIRFNPNDYMGYYYKAVAYCNLDVIRSIENMLKAASLDRGALATHFSVLGMIYQNTGFSDLARHYWQEALKLDGDSARYYLLLSNMEHYLGNKEQAINFYEQAIDKDPSKSFVDLLSYVFYGKHDLAASFQLFEGEALIMYCEQYLKRVNTHGEFGLANMHRVGYAYWLYGDEEESATYFSKQLDYCHRQNDLRRTWSEQFFTYYDLAAIAAYRGDKEQALKHLRVFSQRKVIHLWMVWNLQNDPLLDPIRNELEFRQIVRDMELKYQAEHERVRQWLKESGFL